MNAQGTLLICLLGFKRTVLPASQCRWFHCHSSNQDATFCLFHISSKNYFNPSFNHCIKAWSLNCGSSGELCYLPLPTLHLPPSTLHPRPSRNPGLSSQ